MKDYQFEEITFWLSFISCLISYHVKTKAIIGRRNHEEDNV